MNRHQPPALSEFLDRTGNLLIYLLDSCNLRCKHCYLDTGQHSTHELPFSLVKRTLEEADELGIRSVQLSGGEPLLYPRILEVLQATRGKSFAVALSTNGTLIDDELAALLAEIEAYVVTSIDGPPEHHDRFRGKRSCFARTEDAVARLVDLGVSVKVVMTVCEDSFEHIEWCADWACGIKAKALQFQPLESIGRGKRIEDRRLCNDRLVDLFIQLSDLAVVYAAKDLAITMTYQSRDYMIAHPCSAYVCNGKRCHRGVAKELKKIIIREDGTILPELVDIDRSFAIGSLYTDTLRGSLLSYLDGGYHRFDQLCRQVFNDTVPNNPSPLIPWNEILTERSKELGREQGCKRRGHRQTELGPLSAA